MSSDGLSSSLSDRLLEKNGEQNYHLSSLEPGGRNSIFDHTF